MSLTLYGFPRSYRTIKGLVAAKYNDVDLKFVTCTIANGKVAGVQSPTGKVPVLDTPQGQIFESDAILTYLAGLRTDTGLLGYTQYEKALISQWLSFNSSEIDSATTLLYIPHYGISEFKMNTYLEAKKSLFNACLILNKYLLNNTYLAGNQITIADISVALTLMFGFSVVFDTKMQDNLKNVKRWLTTVYNQPKVKAVIGEFVFCTQEKLAPGQTSTQAEKPKPTEEEKKAAAEKKKAEEEAKKAAAAAKKAEEEAKKAAQPPKEKNPLDLLPKSSMNLEDVKRNFFNKRPYNPEFFPGFWDTYDPEGYSIWEATYKYPEDWDFDYIADNLVLGYINRCEAARKYVFGVITVTGTPGNFKCRCAWIMRGKEMVNEMTEVPDFEEYDYKKLDHTNADAKKYFEDCFVAEKFGDDEVVVRRYCK